MLSLSPSLVQCLCLHAAQKQFDLRLLTFVYCTSKTSVGALVSVLLLSGNRRTAGPIRSFPSHLLGQGGENHRKLRSPLVSGYGQNTNVFCLWWTTQCPRVLPLPLPLCCESELQYPSDTGERYSCTGLRGSSQEESLLPCTRRPRYKYQHAFLNAFLPLCTLWEKSRVQILESRDVCCFQPTPDGFGRVT